MAAELICWREAVLSKRADTAQQAPLEWGVGGHARGNGEELAPASARQLSEREVARCCRMRCVMKDTKVEMHVLLTSTDHHTTLPFSLRLGATT